MRVLVTNGDGIGGPGIAALATALGEAGHTSVVAAPTKDMSGASASIMRMHPDAHIVVARGWHRGVVRRRDARGGPC